MAKYEKLTDWLNHPQRLLLTFKEIEHIIADHLPESAHKYSAWWGKERESEQCHAWLDAGWAVESVDLKAEEVVFRKSSPR
jgi:hypothetical protein